ncbi:MAG: hypothetical protein K8T25_24510 [Planctomycetia bacterium]|nr:hypothetical protein [Planctomycetia bacterium]
MQEVLVVQEVPAVQEVIDMQEAPSVQEATVAQRGLAFSDAPECAVRTATNNAAINSTADRIAAVRDALVQRVGQSRVALWFGGRTNWTLEPGRLDVPGRLNVEVPNAFYQDWLRTNFHADLKQSVLVALGESLEVVFSVAAGKEGAAAADPCDLAPVTMASRASGQPTLSPAPARSPLPAKSDTASIRIAAEAASTEPVDSPPSEPLRRRRPLGELSNFLVGSSNRLAFASAELAVRELGSYSPLYIYGLTGVGKTHLLEGISAAAGRQRPRVRAIYQTAEQFTSEFLEALHHSGLPSFRRKYRNVELLVLDDVQFFAGKRATLVEVMHTIDAVLRSGRQLVLAGDRAPAELAGLGPELVARLGGGMACRINTPDFDVRLGIVRQLAERLKIELTDDVANLVAGRFSEHARELSGAVHSLKATSEAHGLPITRELAEEVLADLVPQAGPAVQLADIERAVCDVLGLPDETLRSERKVRAVTAPRMLAMWLARKHTRSALSEIGSYFGRRSHTTVLAAQKRVETWMSGPAAKPTRTAGSAAGEPDPGWNVEETIRRVEQRLRVG